MFHKEGQKIIFITLVFVVATSLLIDNLQMPWVAKLIQLLLYSVLYSYYNFLETLNVTPNKTTVKSSHLWMERLWLSKRLKKQNTFKEKRLQVSIFMSPINVHVTRYPISGICTF